MSKLNCPCGWQLSNICSPNEIEGGILTDHEIEEIWEKETISANELTDTLRDIWECEKCGRLAISYPGKSDRKILWYEPENNKYNGIMKRIEE